jgi:hypothetical protein
MIISISNICTAFQNNTIGSKVINENGFLAYLADRLSKYDSSRDRVKGQHFVVMPPDAFQYVSAGDGCKCLCLL